MESCILNCRVVTTKTLPSTFVTCVAPPTDPQTSKHDLIFFIVRPANGWPLVVGVDISITQFRRAVSEPEEVLCEADEGKIMCCDTREDIVTALEDVDEGF